MWHIAGAAVPQGRHCSFWWGRKHLVWYVKHRELCTAHMHSTQDGEKKVSKIPSCLVPPLSTGECLLFFDVRQLHVPKIIHRRVHTEKAVTLTALRMPIITATECRQRQHALDNTEALVIEEVLKNIDYAVRNALSRQSKALNVFIPWVLAGAPTFDRAKVEAGLRAALAAAGYTILPSTTALPNSFDISWA